MNKIFDTPATPLFMPDYPYVILVGSVSLYGFCCLVVVLLVVNVKYGDNKETSDV